MGGYSVQKIYRITNKDGDEVAHGTLVECAAQMGYTGAYMALLRTNCNAGRNTRYKFEVVGLANERPVLSECPCKSCIKGPENWPKGLPSCACDEMCSTWYAWWKKYWRELHAKYGR